MYLCVILFYFFFVFKVEEVKNRWRSCRDQFRKELKQHGRSGSGLPKKRAYIYKEQLMFLRPVMELRPTEDNLEEEGEESSALLSSACEEETTTGVRQVELGAGTSISEARPPPASGGESPPPLAPPIRPRRRPVPPAETSVNTQVLDYLSRARQEDHHDHFGRSIAHFLRQLPPHRLLRTRRAIEIVLEESTPPNDPTQMYRALENLSLHGNMFGPQPRPLPPAPPQYHPPRDDYVPPVPPCVPPYQGQPTYGHHMASSSSQPGPSQYSQPPSQPAQAPFPGPQYQGPPSPSARYVSL